MMYDTVSDIFWMCILLFPVTTIGGVITGLVVRTRSTGLSVTLCLIVGNLLWLGMVAMSRWPETLEAWMMFVAIWLVSFIVSLLLGRVLRWVNSIIVLEEDRVLNR